VCVLCSVLPRFAVTPPINFLWGINHQHVAGFRLIGGEGGGDSTVSQSLLINQSKGGQLIYYCI
jgi:hypothetical protein